LSNKRRLTLIRAENLTKRYGQHVAIDRLNFTIEKGEILGFLGPNGAGKSTTMNIVTGYLSATDGRVTVDGLDVLEHPAEVKRKIGYLPELPPLYLDMTVLDYLTFVCELKKVDKSTAKKDLDRILAIVQIDDVKKRLIKNLSKGYKQRVGFAQALIGNPEILILDEPTIGLDPKQIIEIRNLITSLREDHTIVLSSHILPEVSAVCERVLIVNKGHIVASDTVENLSKGLTGGNKLSLRIVGAADRIESALRKIAGVESVDTKASPESGAIDVIVEARKNTDIRREVFHAMSACGCPLLLMRPVDLTLEDIFLQVTRSAAEVSN
jgi:ABC-2 type transport system ATP-binding protein